MDTSPFYQPQSIAPILERGAAQQLPLVSQPKGFSGAVPALGQLAGAGFDVAAQNQKKQSLMQAQQVYSDYLGKIDAGTATQQDHAMGRMAALSLGITPPDYLGINLKKAQLADLTVDPSLMAPLQKDLGIKNSIPNTKENFTAADALSKQLGENKEKRANAVKDQKTKASDEKFWSSNLKEFSTTNTKRGSLLGQAVLGNSKADRALTEIAKHPNAITPQLKSMITQDLSAIMQGGSPHEAELRSQGYGTLADRYNTLVTYLSGNPQQSETPKIIAELKDVLLTIKEVDNKIVRQNTFLFEATNSEQISRNPAKWAKLKQIIEDGLSAPGASTTTQAQGGNDPLGVR